MRKLFSLIIIFVSIVSFFMLGIRVSESQTPTADECLSFDLTFNATGWNSQIMGSGMDVGCAGDYGPAGCRGGVKRVTPGQTVTLDRCTCTPFGDPRYEGRGCVTIGHNLSMEDYDAGGGITRRRVVRAANDPELPPYCTLTVKGNTYDSSATRFFPTREQYLQDPSATFCGTNGAERDKEFSVNCVPPTSPTPSTCPTPGKVTNVRVTCPNCFDENSSNN